MTNYLKYILITVMPNYPKSLFVCLASLVIFSGPVLAQSIGVKDIPKPETGFVESDFAKDVKDGIQSIENDNDGQNNQRQIDENENEDGQQENEGVHVDEQIDQGEAQEGQEGAEGKSGNGKDTSVQDEGGKGQKDSGTNSTN